MDGSSKRDGENDMQQIQGNGAGDSPNNAETKMNEEESISPSSSTLPSSETTNNLSSSSSNNVPPIPKDIMPSSSIKEETTLVNIMNRVSLSDSNSSQLPTGGTAAVSTSSAATTTAAAAVTAGVTAPTNYSTPNAFAQNDAQQLHGQLQAMPSFVWDQAMLTYYYSQNPAAASPLAYYRGTNPMNHLANYLTGTMPYLYSQQPTSPAMWLPEAMNNLANNNNIHNPIHDQHVTNVSRGVESGNNNIGQAMESTSTTTTMDDNHSSKPSDNNETSTADKSWASVARPKSSTSDTSAHSANNITTVAPTASALVPPPSSSSLSQPIQQQQAMNSYSSSTAAQSNIPAPTASIFPHNFLTLNSPPAQTIPFLHNQVAVPEAFSPTSVNPLFLSYLAAHHPYSQPILWLPNANQRRTDVVSTTNNNINSTGNNATFSVNNTSTTNTNSLQTTIATPTTAATTTTTTIMASDLKQRLDNLRTVSQRLPCLHFLPQQIARFFVIKSFNEEDVHRSIKYGIWCSTSRGNERLQAAYLDMQNRCGHVYLLFSVNSSGHFCGIAEMISPVNPEKRSHVWSRDKWIGELQVLWLFVKDIPNSHLRHIRIESNENKPVTNSRDCTEILPMSKGLQVINLMAQCQSSSSLLDDFEHYDTKEMIHSEPSLAASHNNNNNNN